MAELNLIVRFANEKAKLKYKRDDAKKHSWNAKAYAVLDIINYSETGIAQALMVNDAGEIWFIDTRDVRVINSEEYSWDGK